MELTRREVLKAGGATAIGAALGAGPGPAAAGFRLEPEAGAGLRVLRWKKYVQGDEDGWRANTEAFTRATGIQVRTDTESWEDIRPKAAVAANVGSGPDIIFGWFDDPHLYPDRLVDLTDVAEYLGAKYGGWYDAPRRYGMRDGRWIGLPVGAAGNCILYRKSWLQEAGFERMPADTDGFLKACQAMHRRGHPAGFALGNAVGDANTWTHSILWAFGGRMVDESNAVTINRPETLRALEWAVELYKTFIPGTLSWQESSNNKAFLAGEIGCTANGISVYYAARQSSDPGMQALAKDIEHANLPIGPVGRPTELHVFTQAMVFQYSKYPNAAKEYLRFMMEREQYEPWQRAAMGYVTQPLAAYENNPVWSSDPKLAPFRNTVKNMLWNGYGGMLGPASAAAMADYVVVQMFAEAVSGQQTPRDAAARAERRVMRYYKT